MKTSNDARTMTAVKAGLLTGLLTCLLAGILLCVTTVSPQAATGPERRVALVVGNGSYQSVPSLPNPINDAESVAEALRAVGFELIGDKAQLNLDRAGLERAIRTFGQHLRGDGIALFYYAGHGVQINGTNYLVPVSANIATEADVKYELLDIGYVLDELDHGDNRLSVVILDACRNNPFGGRGMRAVTSGLAQMQAPSGTVISYATQPGNVAADGAGNHSPFTEALTASIRTPGRTVFEVFNDVGVAVKKRTGGSQQPWLSTSPIEGQFYFAPPAQTVAATASSTPVVMASAADKEALFWETIKDSRNPVYYRAYVDQFPNGVFAGLARAKLADLTPAPAPAAATTPLTADGPAAAVNGARRAFDPAAVPSLSSSDKEKLAAYATAPSPKVLAMGGGRHYAWVSNVKGDATAAEVRRRALERCQFANGAPCFVYAVDGVVEDHDGTPPAPAPVVIPTSGPFDAAAVPFVTQAVRDTRMVDYGKAAAHKALAIHPDGSWNFVTQRSSAEAAEEAALENCSEKRARGCRVYAIDDTVVLGRDASRAIDSAAAGTGVAATRPVANGGSDRLRTCVRYALQEYEGGEAASPIAGQTKAEAWCDCLIREVPTDPGSLADFLDTRRGRAVDDKCERYADWGE